MSVLEHTLNAQLQSDNTALAFTPCWYRPQGEPKVRFEGFHMSFLSIFTELHVIPRNMVKLLKVFITQSISFSSLHPLFTPTVICCLMQWSLKHLPVSNFYQQPHRQQWESSKSGEIKISLSSQSSSRGTIDQSNKDYSLWVRSRLVCGIWAIIFKAITGIGSGK